MKDIKVLTKLKGEKESFKVVNLDNFLGNNKIPMFDASIKWNQNTDRPVRRRLRRLSEKNEDPARGKANDKEPVSENQNIEQEIEDMDKDARDEMDKNESHPLRRQRSIEKEKEENKKSKVTALIMVNEDGDFETSLGKSNISDIQ